MENKKRSKKRSHPENSRSHPENSQTSTNISDSKRRKQEMDPNVWEQWDERLLEILGNVRHNEDTTMGKRYTTAFYRALARRLSRESGLPFSALDCGIRICGLREMFQSWREDISTHHVMAPERFQFLLRRCFYQEILPVQVPKCFSTNPTRRSTRSGGGCSGGCSGSSHESGNSSRSVGQRSADQETVNGVLAHLFVSFRERIGANKLFHFSRLLDDNPNFGPLFLELGTHEQRIQFIEDLDLSPYVPRTQN